MSRILFEPKRRLLLRIMLAFAVVLLIQAGLMSYLVLGAMERTLESRIDQKLFRAASLAATNSLLSQALAVQYDDEQAKKVLNDLADSWKQLLSVTDVERTYLFRVNANRLLYLTGTLDPLSPLPIPKLTKNEILELSNGQAIISNPFRERDGRLMKAVYVPILEHGLLHGLVAVDDDAKDLERTSLLRRQLNLITIIGFIVVGLVSLLVAQTIVKPMSRLVNAAEQLGHGRFDARFPVKGWDEINFLGQTFNDMAEDIQARDAQIRRMNEDALADARQLYEHVLRTMTSAIFTIDLEDRLTSENPAAATLLGPRRDDMLTIFQRLEGHPQLLELWKQNVQLSNHEVVLNGPEGERFLEVTRQPLIDHRNQQIGFSLSLVDRTETKRLEQELAMRERLAALGELAAGIAHEIRNPLNGIELMLGLVQEDLNKKGVLDERFTRIHDEVSRLNIILTDFLLFARPKPPEKEPANLRELMDEALMFVAADQEQKQIEVVRNYDKEMPPAMLDPAAIRRAVINLLKNACQAMPPGGKLEVTLRGPASTSNGFIIEIRDSGPGIPAEMRERLFHPFFTTKPEGTGLGLAIVHKTIINHQGSINFYNHPEGGACFVVGLP